jgi:drug/metabolite transporter (DMT)-like permease
MPRIDGQLPWRYLLILGIVHTGIMYQLLYSAIQKLPTPITGSLSFIYPLVAMVVDYLVFHHALTPVQLLGGMLILFAAAGNNLGWGEKTPPRRGQ